jgi:hypothetical protein
MPALELSRISKIPPDPWHVQHGRMAVGYTCHMAVLHWALMALGRTQVDANAAIGDFVKRTCHGCRFGTGKHDSIDPDLYGQTFCFGAYQIPNANILSAMVDVGDILITERPNSPMHSMVLRQKRGPNHITVRGFNNYGTLGTGVASRYDDESHNITNHKYWRDPDKGRFGQYGVPLYVVKHNYFMSAVEGIFRWDI